MLGEIWQSFPISLPTSEYATPSRSYVHAQLIEEAAIIGKSTYLTRFVELFTIPRVRRATLASFTVMIAQ